MKQIRMIDGDGSFRIGVAAANAVHYAIGVWRKRSGDIFGRGYISGAVEAMFQAASRHLPLRLKLAGGRSVEVVVTDRGMGEDFAEIYVSQPLEAPALVPQETGTTSALPLEARVHH